MKRIFAAIAVFVVAALGGAVARAAWLSPSGAGSAQATATSLGTGSTPTVSASGSTVTVSWTATANANGYQIKRYNALDVAQTIGANCAGTITALTCTETGVAAGTWKYSITPLQSTWTGAESTRTSVVVTTVVAPSITISSLVVNSNKSVSATGTSNLPQGTTFSVVLCKANAFACSSDNTAGTLTATVNNAAGNWTTTSSGNLNNVQVWARATHTNAAGTGTSNVAGPVTP